jgi:hypothetical protein
MYEFNNLEQLCRYITNSKASFGITTNWRSQYKEGTIVSISCPEKYRQVLKNYIEKGEYKDLIISVIHSIYPGASELRLYNTTKKTQGKKFYRCQLDDSKLLTLQLTREQIVYLLDNLRSVGELDENTDVKRSNIIADIEWQVKVN